tara:strand:- start:1811 stop:2389 length:579 start_codon:yes stop_codon:yes gene_type:complete
MQNQVNIIADDMGNVIRQSRNNADFGHVRLESKQISFSSSTNFVGVSTVSTLLHGEIDVLKQMDLNKGMLPGRIQVREQLTPFTSNDPDRDYKKAGDTGIICCIDGQPIYRKTFYTPDAQVQDVLLAHNNGDAIREANGHAVKAETTTKVTAQSAKDFGINVDAAAQDEVEEVVENEEVVDLVEEEAETFEL